ncbi:MAG: TlpA family protein disulfide reductase [Aeromicrobium sp.]
MTGFLILLAALAATVVLAWAMSKKNGSFATRDSAEFLSASDIGADLGDRATLVQFSSAFCAPCRATRVLLTDVASKVEGVVAVDVDAESQLDLVRRLNIMRTPTVLVLDSNGAVVQRASGLPRRESVIAALGEAIP